MICNTIFSQDYIYLITPYDRDTIETFYPLFSWNYNQLDENRNDVQYIFTLVEINEEQTATSALQVNTPILRIQNLSGFQLMYPFDAPILKVNQRYGWRVQRTINNIIMHESEAWEFIIVKELNVPLKYVKLALTPQNAPHIVKNEGFYFKVNTNYSVEKLKFILSDERGNEIDYQFGQDTKLKTEVELTTTSKNSYYLKTASLPMGIYTLVVRDPKGVKQYTKFEIK